MLRTLEALNFTKINVLVKSSKKFLKFKKNIHIFNPQNYIPMLDVLHYHRQSLYFDVFIVLLYLYTNIANNPLRTFFGLKSQEK